MGGPGGPHGQNTKQIGTASANGTALTTGEDTETGKTYISSNEDENAVQVKGGILTMTDCTIKKISGDTKDYDGSSFYGVNSAIYAGNGGTIHIKGGTIETNATGANAVIASGGKITIANTRITNIKNLSRGLHATNGGTIVATDLDVNTAGNNSSVIATDRGGGTVTVTGGRYVCTGVDCAVTYSTGDITVNDAEGSSKQGEVGVIEGNNTITLNNCKMTSGSKTRGLMILQSGSGDAEGFNGRIAINGGTVTLTEEGTPLLEVPTNITGTLTLKDVELNVPSNVLMRVDKNQRWETYGGIGNLILTTGDKAIYDGNVEADKYATANVTVDKGVTWNGCIDKTKEAKYTTVTVKGTWNLTSDSHVSKLNMSEGGVINRNGFKLNVSEN